MEFCSFTDRLTQQRVRENDGPFQSTYYFSERAGSVFFNWRLLIIKTLLQCIFVPCCVILRTARVHVSVVCCSRGQRLESKLNTWSTDAKGRNTVRNSFYTREDWQRKDSRQDAAAHSTNNPCADTHIEELLQVNGSIFTRRLNASYQLSFVAGCISNNRSKLARFVRLF